MDQADFLLLPTGKDHPTTTQYLKAAAERDLPVAAVVSAKSSVSVLTETVQFPKAVVAMNRAEYYSIQYRMSKRSPQEVRRALNARIILVTSGPDGWRVYRPDLPAIYSPAPPAPKAVSFVGCGDYAAAALCHATAHGLDDQTIVQNVNEQISAKIKHWRNAA